MFAIRLHKQFLGEYLSDGPGGSAPATAASRWERFSRRRIARASSWAGRPAAALFSPVVAACLRKEWLDLGASWTQLVGALTPLVFVVILGKGIFDRRPEFFLPGAVGYVLMGLLPRLYNIFGADGSGVQVYLLAPIRLRDVVVAKNIANVALILFQAMLAWAIVSLLVRTRIPLSTQVSAVLWLVFVVVVNLTVGTLRSIQAPRKFVPGQTRQTRAPANRTSTLLVLALFSGSILLQIPVTLLSRQLELPWLPALIFAPLAGGAVLAYVVLLGRADELILSHRDLLAEELCRV